MSNNLEHLDVKYWVETIICHPELEDQCPWEKLRSSAWRNILMERPEFIRHAPKEIPLSFMSTKQWLEVLIAHPELDKYVPSAKVLVDKDSDILGGLWGTLLSRHPEFAKYKPWSHLRRDDWRKVLCQQPQFIDKYESVCSVNKSWLFTLSPMDQAIIIACQPALFKNFNTDVFGDGAWTTVLCSQPQFLEYCKLNKFPPLYLGQILKCYPEWLAYCETYSRSPEDILRIALNFPEVLNHYELDRFTEIGNGDTPWIEKFPCLVPYSQWNFSYPYWNSLMTHCSDWLETGRRPCVDVLAKKFDWISSNEKCHGRKDAQGDSLTENQPAKNLRNSLKTIMSFLKCGISDRSTQQANSIPLRIRNILENLDLTYEELMIKMSMMSEDDCGAVFYGIFICSLHEEFLEQMVERDLDRIFSMVPLKYLLPLMILFASANTLNFVLYKLFLYDNNAIADFRDDEGNNAWHYFFFRNPMFNPSRKSEYDVREYDCYEFLTENGASPDTPNNMGFSYNQINQAMKKYLGVKK